MQGTSSGKQSGQIMRAVSALVRKVFLLPPKGMIDHLGLRRPIFGKTAVFGHFGWFNFFYASNLQRTLSIDHSLEIEWRHPYFRICDEDK
jgi:S-adenosylmethionine synthetase